MPLGLPELLVILVIMLVIFGPKRLPRLGRQIGGGMREFRKVVTSRHEDDDDDVDVAPVRRTLPAASDSDVPRS